MSTGEGRGTRIRGHHRLRVIELQSHVDARYGYPSTHVQVPAKVQDDILSDISRWTTIHGQVMADNLTPTLEWEGAVTN